MIQELSNELVVVKRQLPRFNHSYQWIYQNPPRRNTDEKFPHLTGPQPRLAIEVAPKKGNMCMFHLTTDHDSEIFLEPTRMMQLLSTNEMNTTTPCSESELYPNGDSRNLFLEYESDSEPKGGCYTTID